MTPEGRQFLTYVSQQPHGRVGFAMDRWAEASALAAEALSLGLVRHRPLWPHKNGFQVTEAGRAYLAGAPLDA